MKKKKSKLRESSLHIQGDFELVAQKEKDKDRHRSKKKIER